MRRPISKWIDIYFYSHPLDQSIRYIGSEKFGKEPLWLLNDKRFREWIGQFKVDINIIDTIPTNEAEFWTEFYIDLFSQWGFSLIKNDFAKDLDYKRVFDIHRIKNSIVNTLYEEEYLEKPIQLKDFSEFYYEFDELCSKCQDSFIRETSLLLHCLFINGIPWENCIQLSPTQIRKGYIMVGNTILTFSERIKEYSRSSQESNRLRIFREIPKVCNKSHLKLFVTRYINALSTYFGYVDVTEGEFLKDFGRLKYWQSGTSHSTTIFLIRMFRCKNRLELLMKLDLIPYLR